MKLLSQREVDIIRHAAQGFTAKEIAKLTGLEYRTVESYVITIRKKLSARNITHAVFLAIQHEMLMAS